MKLVIQNTSRVWGGNEKWLATLAGGLLERGHEVVVSCRPGVVARELKERGIRTSPFRPRGPIDFVSGLTFAAWLRSERPDVVLLTSWRVTPWVVFAAKLARVPRIVMRLGIVREFPRNTPKAVALRSVDAIIVNSGEIRDAWIASAPPFGRDRVHVVLNGVRSRGEERDRSRGELRDEIGLASGTILVGGAGHLARRKGFEVLLESLSIVDDAQIELAILGDGEHRAVLASEAERLGVADRVHWLGHRTDGAGTIAGFDIFVLSSHNEGMANVMLEAMAAGVPVIAFDISGVRQAIERTAERPPAGWTVPAGDSAALAAAIHDVARGLRERPSQVEERAREGHWRAVHWFSPDRMVSECERILFAQ